MKHKIILTVTIIVLALISSACISPNGATLIGTPTSIPTEGDMNGNDVNVNDGQELGSLNEAEVSFIKETPIWQTSTVKNGIVDDQIVIAFDTENNSLTVISAKDNSETDINYSADENGDLIASDGIISIKATLNPDSVTYPLNVEVNSNKAFGSSETNIAAFDDINQPQLMCKNSVAKCYDTDGKIKNQGSFFITGFAYVSDPGVPECGRRIDDRCYNDRSLVEVICSGDNNNFSYRLVTCNCQEGRCIDDPSDKPVEFIVVMLEGDVGIPMPIIIP